MRAARVRTALVIAAGAAIGSAASGQTITNIGVLSPTGLVESLAISGDGTAVTGYASYGGGFRAVRWSVGGGLQDLGLVPGGLRALGFAISGDGATVTGMCVISGAGHVFRWTGATGMADLGSLPGQNVSYGYAMSGNGQVIGGGTTSNGVGHAFVWSQLDGMIDLGLLPGADAGGSSAVLALDATGSLGAGYSDSLTGRHAVRWDIEVNAVGDLGVLMGGATSEATAISASGAVIVGTSGSSGGDRAFRWTQAGGLEDLGTVTGRSTSQAAAVNADGSVVVGTDGTGAVLWTRSLGMVDLQSYLVSHGMSLTGWTLSACNGVSADGTAMTGTGRYNGATRGWVIRGLPPFTCPADFNGAGGVTVQDIFDFLAA
jgi:probable HAF family extracellular repeat protein